MKGYFEMTNGKTKVTVPESQVKNLTKKGYKKVEEKPKTSSPKSNTADKS